MKASGIRKTADKIFSLRWLIGAVLLIILTAGAFHGDSMACYDRYIESGEGGPGLYPILGTERMVRVDEWAINNPARISGESGDRPVYGGSAAAAERTEEKPESAAAEDAKTWTPARIAETYWEVFSACFEGYDYNPVTFRFHEDGWDSASQMALVAGLEAAFGISFKGREVLKMNSFESGLKLVRKKLDEKNREEG